MLELVPANMAMLNLPENEREICCNCNGDGEVIEYHCTHPKEIWRVCRVCHGFGYLKKGVGYIGGKSL
jgi:DnaJ-class molecular chaperone